MFYITYSRSFHAYFFNSNLQFIQSILLYFLGCFLYVIRKKNVTIIYGSLMLIAFIRTYFVDVTYQVSSKETSDRYYFYERYVPYYSIFETPDNNVIARRKAIYINSMDMENN